MPRHVTIPKIFLRPLAKNFKESDKLIINILNTFCYACYDNSGGVRNYILKTFKLSVQWGRLISLRLIIFVVHCALHSLSLEYEQPKLLSLEKSGAEMTWFQWVEEDDRLIRKRVEKGHLSLIAPSKKSSSNSKWFRFQKKNNKCNKSKFF